MTKEKICFVTPSLEIGGMQRVINIVANYAVKRNYTVTIICLFKTGIEYDFLPDIQIIEPDFPYKKGLKNKIFTFNFLYKKLQQLGPDCVLSFSEVFNPLAIVASKLLGLRVYISDRSNPYKALRLSIQFLRKLTYPLAHGMIAQTKLAKEVALKRGYNKNIAVIPNPLRKINDQIKKEYKNRIISVGRLVETKKFDDLIDIFISVENNDDWELWILGEGPEKENLQRKISALNVDHKVKLLGAVKNVDKYFAQASIFAFTSISEGFPNALTEAIAFPLASIAYDCPAGPNDIIENGENGFLIPLNNKKLFKKKLNKLMASEKLRHELVGNYTHYKEKYLQDKIVESYLAFIS